MNPTAINPMFSKFDQALGKTTPTTSRGPVSSRADEILALGKSSTTPVAKANDNTLFTHLSTLYGGSDQGIGAKLKQDIQAGASDMQKGGIGNISKGVIKSGLRTAGDVAGTIFAPVSEGLNAATGGKLNETFQGIQSNIEEGKGLVGQLVDKITNLPAVQDFAMKHPNAGEDFGRLMNIILSGGESNKIEPSTIVDRTATQIKNAPSTIIDTASKISDKTKGIATDAVNKGKEIIGATKEKAIETASKDWEKPSTIAKATYGKVKDTLNTARRKGFNPPQFLAEQGINPDTHIQEGKFATEDTANKLRETAGKMSADTLRPSLEIADYSVAKTPIKEILTGVIKDLKNTKGITPGDMETQITKAKTEADALERKHPDGISLTDAHDSKITYAQNGKYSPVGDTTVNNIAGVNRSFGRVLANLVENKAPADLDVSGFNKYLQNYYKSADYLDSLHNKTVPIGIGIRVARGVAKGVGAMVGAHFGGFPTEFAGYSIGGALEHAVENMPNPIKGYFLRNLEKTNPEAFKKMTEFLGTKEMSRYTTLSLPEPSPLGSDKNPIIPVAPTTFESQAEKANSTKTNKTGDQYVRDLKTGKLNIIPNKKAGFIKNPFIGQKVTAEGMPNELEVIGDADKAMVKVVDTKTGQTFSVGKNNLNDGKLKK